MMTLASLGTSLTFAQHASAQSGFPSGLNVSVGYADNLRASGFFPTPWYGSSGVIFEGCAPPSSCSYDAGAIELVNNSGSTVTVNSVQAQFTSACVVNLWPANVSLPAGGTLIDTQTVSGASSGCPSGGLFDTSDVGPNGSSWVGQCTNSGIIPQLIVTANAVAQTFTDSSQVLNTGGIDLAACPNGTNESEPWTQVSTTLAPGNELGSGNPGAPQIPTCNAGGPVNCATGNHWETLNEITIPGRGVPVGFSLTYNALAASQTSPVGFGWSLDDGAYLTVNSTAGTATATEENGSTITFSANGSTYTAPSWAPDTLTKNVDGSFTFLRLHDKRQYVFSASGQLQREVDRNGYATTFIYTAGRLTAVTDPAGRSLTFAYDASGDIASATDPSGRKVTLAYDASGNLASITNVGGGVTSFAYDASHLMLTETDPRGGQESTQYDSLDRVVSQTDPMLRKTTWSYLAGTTTITDPNGNVSREHFSNYEPVAIERGYGTSADSTRKNTYDLNTLGVATATDANGHQITSTWDQNANVLSRTDALNRKATYTYDGLNDLISMTDPLGVKTAYTYDLVGNVTGTSRPLTATGQTQATTLTYGDSSHPGDVTATTDADGKTTSFTHDTNGDLASVTDPAGDKKTYAYDNVGRRTSMVSARGNVSGANPATYTTTYAYDAFDELTSLTDPLGRVASSTYDADHNLTSATDPQGQKVSSTFDADNEATAITRADGSQLQNGYDGDGNLTSQTDGAGKVTGYAYDPLNRQVSNTDPLNRKTNYTYDSVGNLTSLTDPSSQVTTFSYDAANQRTAIAYSDGKTPGVSLTYDADGQRLKMTDGAGATTYSYDSLNRLTASTNGAGQIVGYGYDLKGQVTSITYPNGKTVSRAYDPAGRLSGVTDWLAHTTSFNYDADSDLTAQAYANGTNATNQYDAADQLNTISDTKSGSTLASFTYTRNSDGLLSSLVPTGVSQSNETYAYSQLNQLTSVNSGTYTYDAADNLTQLTNGRIQQYDVANELSTATTPISLVGTASGGDGGTTKSVTLNLPAGLKASDQIFVASTGDSSISVTTPAGYTVVGTVTSGGGAPDKTVVFRKTAVGTETQVTVSYNKASAKSVVAAVYRGVDPTSPVDAQSSGSSTGYGSTTGPSVTAPSISPTLPGEKLVMFEGASANSTAADWSPPAGMTDEVHKSDIAFSAAALSDQTLTAAGATGSRTAFFGPVCSPQIVSITCVRFSANLTALMVALKPTAAVTSFSYDPRGNRTSMTPPGGPTTTLTYDQANRLTGYGTNATYAYDGDGLRTSKTSGTTTQHFAWNNAGIPLLLTDGSINYVYGPGGRPLEQIDASGNVLFLHQDQLGSTRLLTDANGTVQATYTYDAYGNITSKTGSAMTVLQYAGQYTDAESGLQYLRARYYDATTGQFLTRDPDVARTRAPYTYAEDNPVNVTDPSGKGPQGLSGSWPDQAQVGNCGASGGTIPTLPNTGGGSGEAAFYSLLQGPAIGWPWGADFTANFLVISYYGPIVFIFWGAVPGSGSGGGVPMSVVYETIIFSNAPVQAVVGEFESAFAIAQFEVFA